MTKQVKRWEFVPNSEINVDGRILRRIRALVNMPQYGVQAGDFGGYVEHEENLPQKSHAWIFHNAQVYGKAKVFDYAQVYGKARVFDHAQVSGKARVFDHVQVSGKARVFDNAWVSDYALVCDNARVYDDAWVYNKARIYDDARVYSAAHVHNRALVGGDAVICDSADWIYVGPSASSRRFTTAHRDAELGVRVNCGCFSGSLAEFAAAIEKTHQNSPQDLARYRAFHRLIMDVFGQENTNDK